MSANVRGLIDPSRNRPRAIVMVALLSLVTGFLALMLNTLPEAALTRFRRQTAGFVFQNFNLIPNLNALENVMLPMEFDHVPVAERRRRAAVLLERVGLTARRAHRPAEPSGGEQQRVAIARALANHPPLVLADEPPGNLASRTGGMIYELLKEISRERTVVVVTHAEARAALADGLLHLTDERLAVDMKAMTP